MKHIQGNSIEEKLLSVDGILGGLLRKQQMADINLNKRNINPLALSISGYAEMCSSGDIICSYLSLGRYNLKKAVVFIDTYSEDKDLSLTISILSDTEVESSNKAKLAQGRNFIIDERIMNPGDRLSIKIEFPEESPIGIWVAMRGEQA